MAQMSDILIGIVLIGFFFFAYNYVISEQVTNNNLTYDNTTLVKYTQYKESMNNLTAEMRNQTSQTKESNVFDILGSITQGATNTVKLGGSSYDTMSSMTDDAIVETHMAETSYFKWILGTIIALVITFYFLKIVLKVDL